MSHSALSKLWGFFALALLSFSFLFFLRTTGSGPESGGFGVLGYQPTTIPILALPFDLFLMGVTLWLTWVWSTKVGGATWAHRLPIFYFERKDIDPGTLGGRVYQGWALFLVLILPPTLIVQMAARFFDGKVYVGKKQAAQAVAQGWGHFDIGVLTEAGKKGMLRFGEPDGPEYFLWEPWLFGLLSLLMLSFWIGTVWTIFRTTATAR